MAQSVVRRQRSDPSAGLRIDTRSTVMLIYGHRTRETLLGMRSFYCPRCRAQTGARHIRVDRWLTLFFIPLFKIAALGDLLECQTCYGAFKTDPGGRVFEASSTAPIGPAAGGCWIAGLIVAGLLMSALGVLVGLLFVWTQLQDPGDNVTGFVGATLLCPVPLTVAGLLAFGGGLLTVWRRRQAGEV